jgi:hypothetical protein
MTAEIDPLTQLAIHYGTDKFGPHFYTPIYHELFAHMREMPVRLLEIGVGGYGWRCAGGASLAMWAAYFARGSIVSIDIADKNLDLGSRVTIHRGSQTDANFIGALCDQHGPFDIVIDDGSHVPAHVARSFELLFPRLADRGLYVIEDVQTAFWPSFGGALDGAETMGLWTSLLRLLNHAELCVEDPTSSPPQVARTIRSVRAFHNLIVIEKGDNDEPSNFGNDPGNPHARRAREQIEQALAASPTAAGFANLAMTALSSGDRGRAASIVKDALAKWPQSTELLLLTVDLADDKAGRMAALAKLASIEGPGSAVVDRVRTYVERGEPAFWERAES